MPAHLQLLQALVEKLEVILGQEPILIVKLDQPSVFIPIVLIMQNDLLGIGLFLFVGIWQQILLGCLYQFGDIHGLVLHLELAQEVR